MSPLQPCRSLTRLVLVWFVLALGAAAATPLVRPPNLQLVCSSAGLSHLVDVDQGGTRALGDGLASCPLCIVPGAPPPWQAGQGQSPSPVVALSVVGEAQRTPLPSAPPLPARGPPPRY